MRYGMILHVEPKANISLFTRRNPPFPLLLDLYYIVTSNFELFILFTPSNGSFRFCIVKKRED